MKQEEAMAQHTNDRLVKHFEEWQNVENDTLSLAEDLQKKPAIHSYGLSWK